MTSLFSNRCRIQPLSSYYNFYTSLDVLRLDEIDQTISGNKWFKLKHYLLEAKELHKICLVTFGGPYSNHIVATAAMARLAGLKSINDPKSEFLIPFVADQFIKTGRGMIKVLPTSAPWFGVTYKEDAPVVQRSLDKLVADKIYPNKLW